MRPLRALAIYILVVFIGGALLAPWLHALAQVFAGTFPRLAATPFHRFLNRALLIVALAGLWPLLRALGATSLREIGLNFSQGFGKKLLGGFTLGLVSLILVGGITIAAGVLSFKDGLTAAVILKSVFVGATSALAVALLEEILFRGGIFGGLRRVFDWRFAALVSSLIYAFTHFLKSAADTNTVTWLTGLEFLPRMMDGFAHWQDVVPFFISLTVIGLVLALAYQRTDDLNFSIGLHAGWIFALRIFKTLTVAAPGNSSWFWADGSIQRGWLTLVTLGAMLALLPMCLPQPKKTEPS